MADASQIKEHAEVIGADDVHVGIVVHGLVLETFLGVDVVVEVGGGEGNADFLVAEGAGQNDFLVAGLVFDLWKVSKVT